MSEYIPSSQHQSRYHRLGLSVLAPPEQDGGGGGIMLVLALGVFALAYWDFKRRERRDRWKR